MTVPAADMWEGAPVVLDEGQCPVCLSDACEDAAHVPPMASASEGRRPGDTSSDREPVSAPTFQTAADLMQAARPVAIIEGVAWDGNITVIVSESGIGKTFLKLGASAAVSDDLPWLGRTVRHGSVAYLSFEGDALGLRLRALAAQGHRLEHLYVLRASAPLSPTMSRDGGETPSLGEILVTDALKALAAELETAGRPPIVLLMIDTVRASLAGSEDSSEHVSAYLRAVRRLLAQLPGAAVILAHHAGWLDGEGPKRKRERGSSAFRGNCDATLYLEHDGEDPECGETRLVLRALKVRDEERPAPLHLVRRVVELNERDARGELVTSCVIAEDRRTREDREADVAATVAAEHRELDRRTLQAISNRPAVATSQDGIRVLVGRSKDIVRASLTRLITAGYVMPGTRGQSYQVTTEGQEWLARSDSGPSGLNRTEADRVPQRR